MLYTKCCEQEQASLPMGIQSEDWSLRHHPACSGGAKGAYSAGAWHCGTARLGCSASVASVLLLPNPPNLPMLPQKPFASCSSSPKPANAYHYGQSSTDSPMLVILLQAVQTTKTWPRLHLWHSHKQAFQRSAARPPVPDLAGASSTTCLSCATWRAPRPAPLWRQLTRLDT